MKVAILMIVFIVGVSAAQFMQAEERLTQCEKACCTANGGTWNELVQACDINASSSAYISYTACNNACFEEAGDEFEGAGGYKGLCCAPAFLILVVLSLKTPRE